MTIASVALTKNYVLIVAISFYPYVFFTLVSLVEKFQIQIQEAQKIVSQVV